MHLPEQVKAVLSNGPSLCTESRTTGPGQLALIHWVADKAREGNRGRYIAECVECLVTSQTAQSRKLDVSATTDFFKSSNLKLLATNKEGGFSVLTDGTYRRISCKGCTFSFNSEGEFYGCGLYMNKK